MKHAKRKIQLKWNVNIYIETILVLLYKLFLDFSLLSIMSAHYEIPGIVGIHMDRFLYSTVMVLALYLMNEKLIKSDVIRLLVKIMILVMFVPISTAYTFSEYSLFKYLIMFLELVLVILTVMVFTIKKDWVSKIKGNLRDKLKIEKIRKKLNTTKLIYALFLVNTIFIIFACIYFNGLPSLTALNLKEVYEVRDEFFLPKFIKYLYDFEVKFIIPFFIVLSLERKKYIRFGLSILTLFLFFLWKGDKIVLFSIPLVIGVYLLYKLVKSKNKDRYITVFITIIAVFTILLTLINNFQMYSLLIRRTLIVPANLKFIYMDFFETNPKIGIYGTIFNAIFNIESPYGDLEYQRIIGKEYLGSQKIHANTGFLVEGFVRWGYIGIILIPVVLGIILCIIHYGTKNNNLSFIAGISVLPIFSLNDGYLLPSATFGAITLLMIICIFFRVKDLKRRREIPDEYRDVTGQLL